MLNRKVSVIIPVYKVEKYLARCLDSVLGQTYRDLEVICINDGSPDNSGAILAAYALQDVRVKVLTQENKGQSAARNTGLDIATGAWIMFVDSDDWIPADAVQSFVQVAEASGAPIVASATYAIDKFNATLPRTLHWSLKTPALKHLVGNRKMQSSVWNKIFRADVLKNRRFIEGIYFEDWVYITEALGDIDSFAKIKEPMYVYCKNGGDTSTIRSPFTLHKAFSYRTGIAHVRDYFKDHPMKKWGLKRADIAQRMLEKRVKRMVDETNTGTVGVASCVPKVSVLLPVYKTKSPVLREAIESVLAQTYGDFELLVLDDCPQNTREKIVRSYGDPRIKYAYNEENLGIAGTRNKLMQMARGDYFAVIDHDDIWLPTKLEKQVAFMESHPDIVACGTAYRRHKCIFRRHLVCHEEEHDDIYARLFFRCTMYHGSVLLRASTVREHNLKYNRVYISLNDRVLYLRLGRHGKLHNLQEPLCLYRLHSHMVSIIYREAILEEHRRVRRALLNFIGLELDAEEFEIFNEYLMRGKRLPSEEMIERVNALLVRCVVANNKTGAFPKEAFRHMCAMYRMKRDRKLSLKLYIKRFLQRGHF